MYMYILGSQGSQVNQYSRTRVIYAEGYTLEGYARQCIHFFGKMNELHVHCVALEFLGLNISCTCMQIPASTCVH